MDLDHLVILDQDRRSAVGHLSLIAGLSLEAVLEEETKLVGQGVNPSFETGGVGGLIPREMIESPQLGSVAGAGQETQ
jgi:hypothetical protein